MYYTYNTFWSHSLHFSEVSPIFPAHWSQFHKKSHRSRLKRLVIEQFKIQFHSRFPSIVFIQNDFHLFGSWNADVMAQIESYHHAAHDRKRCFTLSRSFIRLRCTRTKLKQDWQVHHFFSIFLHFSRYSAEAIGRQDCLHIKWCLFNRWCRPLSLLSQIFNPALRPVLSQI